MNRPKWLRHLFLRLAGYNPASILDVSTKEGLAVAGAMRGPDDGFLRPFKWLLTARIRYWKGVGHFNYADVRSMAMTASEMAKLRWHLETLVKEQDLHQAAHHFFDHAFSALWFLKVPADQEECDKLINFARAMSSLTDPMQVCSPAHVEAALERLRSLDEFYSGDDYWGDIDAN
jgi:hypothetical protein